jgi:predicted GTPase
LQKDKLLGVNNKTSTKSWLERLDMQDRIYQRKRRLVENFIKKHGKRVDHSLILNEVDVDYDTLMRILSELRNEGGLK